MCAWHYYDIRMKEQIQAEPVLEPAVAEMASAFEMMDLPARVTWATAQAMSGIADGDLVKRMHAIVVLSEFSGRRKATREILAAVEARRERDQEQAE